MNIFVLDECVATCAEYHADRHVVKMILETAQMLSTAHRVLDGQLISGKTKTGRNCKLWRLNDTARETSLYSATHTNHPCSSWIRKSTENYKWAYSLLVALSKEYTRRYSKVHKVFRTDLHALLVTPPAHLPVGSLTEFALAMPDQYKTKSAVESYRAYYLHEKQHLHSWKKTPTPDWIENARTN